MMPRSCTTLILPPATLSSPTWLLHPARSLRCCRRTSRWSAQLRRAFLKRSGTRRRGISCRAFGVAFRPFANTVVRAGYGMFIDSFGTYVTPPQAGPLYGVCRGVPEFKHDWAPTYVFPNPFVGTAGRGGTLDVGTNSYPAFDVNIRNPRIASVESDFGAAAG